MLYEENFDEICWSLEEQHTENYLNNFKIILK